MGGGLSKRGGRRRKGDADSDSDSDDEGEAKKKKASGGGGGLFGSAWQKEYEDPPMPDIGKAVGFSEIEDRTRAIKFAMKTMMKVVSAHAQQSINEAATIPVSRELERVVVNEEIYKRIRARQGKRDDMLWVRDNLTEIQGELAIRRAALKMFNHNYSGVVVRKIDPIQTDEARTILVPKDVVNHNPDEETKSPSKSPTKR